MLDTLLVALVISVDTAQVKEFPQKAEVEFKKNDLKENIIKSALNFHNSSPTSINRRGRTARWWSYQTEAV